MRKIVGPLLAGALAASFPSPPLYMQCDPKWANTPMGTKGNGEDSTICGEGCAMSSLSMAMAAYGVNIPVGAGLQPADPLTFNAWLETHNGYDCAAGDCNNLVLDAVSSVDPSFSLVGEIKPAPSFASVSAGLAAGNVVYLAHVNTSDFCPTSPCHFVLLTGTAGQGVYTVNDPYYNMTTYPQSWIFDMIIYTVSGKAAVAARTGAVVASKAGVTHRMSAVPAGSSPVIPSTYPLYKQCDDAWGADTIGNETVTTICDVGCLMSSISMALAFNNITLPDLGGSLHWETSNPQSLNTWLQLNNGYQDGDDFDEDDLPLLNPAHIAWSDAYGMHTKNDVPYAQIQSIVASGQPVIANVMAGRHFVLVVGWDAVDGDTLYVNDPGFSITSYSYSKDVVGWRLFNMTALPYPGAK